MDDLIEKARSAVSGEAPSPVAVDIPAHSPHQDEESDVFREMADRIVYAMDAAKIQVTEVTFLAMMGVAIGHLKLCGWSRKGIIESAAVIHDAAGEGVKISAAYGKNT